MKRSEKMLMLGAAVLLIILYLPALAMGFDMFTGAENLIISFEGFSPSPYWDVKRYSWGYGTPAPGSTGQITEQQARAELRKHVQADYDYLQPMVTVPLTNNQWAALLSFSYNEGPGNADNLIPQINAEDWDGLFTRMRLYNLAGGVYNSNLADRREKEIQFFQS